MKYISKIEGCLRIEGRHYLETLSSILPNLLEVTEYVYIGNNNGLVRDIVGFEKLERVGQYVDIKGNPSLEVLDDKIFPLLKSSATL